MERAYGFPCDASTRLRLRAWNSASSVTLGLRGLIRSPKGELLHFTHTLTPTTDRALSALIQPTGPGELVACTITADAGSPLRGQTFAQLSLTQNGDAASLPVATLLSDYVQNNSVLGWPGSKLRSSLDGKGWMRSLTGTDPAAGVEISETVPTGARWQLQAFRATFVSDATVTTRFTSLLIDDGALTLFGHSPNSGVAANTTNNITWAPAGIDMSGLRAQTLYPLPFDLKIFAGSRIRTSTFALQAGDNWGAPQILVEEWIQP